MNDNDSLLDEILTEYYEEEFSRYSDVPEHIFSLKHRLAMKKIFKIYERNTEYLRPKTSLKLMSTHKVRLTPGSALLLVLIIFLGVLAGCTAAYLISQGFRGNVHSDNTEIYPVDTDNCPTVIEEKYYLSELPEGFEIIDADSSPFHEYVCYENRLTNQIISLTQRVKTDFGTYRLNTENHKVEEVDINGNNGLFVDFTEDERIHSLVLWDNDDYILEISADLPKNELIDLAKSAKVLE